MKTHLYAVALLAIASLAPLHVESATPAPAAADPDDVVLVPPKETASDVKPHVINGGSRGAAADEPTIAVLSPDQVALTIQARPTLYWYQSKDSKAACEVTLVQHHTPKPLLLLTTPAPSTAGVHSFRLANFGVELKPGAIYSWSVAVVLDPASRSADVVANGVIKRIPETPELAAELAAAPDHSKPAIYARNSLFYDALQSLSDQIDQSPQDQTLRDRRAKLLAQIGLKDVKFADLAKTP